jgi:hypothetical protein
MRYRYDTAGGSEGASSLRPYRCVGSSTPIGGDGDVRRPRCCAGGERHAGGDQRRDVEQVGLRVGDIRVAAGGYHEDVTAPVDGLVVTAEFGLGATNEHRMARP